MFHKILAILSVITAGTCLAVIAAPALIDGQEAYFRSMKTCTPAEFKYDALMMGIENTSRVAGKEDGKCVIKEEINPQMTLVCRLPMRILTKYADENLRTVKASFTGPAKSEFVEKIQSNPKYCNIEFKR